MDKQGFVYILGNWTGGVLYVGVTSDLLGRVRQHKERVVESFASRYNVDRLLYYEVHPDISSAIDREKRIKGGSRRRKEGLIERLNPDRIDLYPALVKAKASNRWRPPSVFTRPTCTQAE